MAVTFSSANSATFSGTTFTPTTPTAPGGGALSSANVIWLFTFVNDGSGNGGTAVNGWTKPFQVDTGTGPNLAAYWRQATGSEGATLATPGTWGGSNATNSYIIFSTAGQNTSSPEAGTHTENDSGANGTTLTVPSYTPPDAVTMLICVGGHIANNITNASTVSVSGMTEIAQFNTQGTSKRVWGVWQQQLASSAATGTRDIVCTQSGGGSAGALFGMSPTPTGPVESVGMVPI